MALAFALVVLLLPAGCCRTTPPVAVPDNASTAEATAGVAARVEVRGSEFTPRTVTVAVGDAVRWTNADRSSHNVGGSGIVSGLIESGESFTHTFDQPGTYQYICTIHPDGAGAVEVVPAAP